MGGGGWETRGKLQNIMIQGIKPKFEETVTEQFFCFNYFKSIENIRIFTNSSNFFSKNSKDMANSPVDLSKLPT